MHRLPQGQLLLHLLPAQGTVPPPAPAPAPAPPAARPLPPDPAPGASALSRPAPPEARRLHAGHESWSGQFCPAHRCFDLRDLEGVSLRSPRWLSLSAGRPRRGAGHAGVSSCAHWNFAVTVTHGVDEQQATWSLAGPHCPPPSCADTASPQPGTGHFACSVEPLGSGYCRDGQGDRAAQCGVQPEEPRRPARGLAWWVLETGGDKMTEKGRRCWCHCARAL